MLLCVFLIEFLLKAIAFGLWGHSDDSGDALAVHQGAVPVLTPSDRDRQTLSWVRTQPNRFGPITAPIAGQ